MSPPSLGNPDHANDQRHSIPDEQWLEELVCPECRVELCGREGTIRCNNCHRSWQIVEGVPQFVSDFPYWGEIPLEHMLEVNRRAKRGSWKAALLDFQDASVQQASEMILNLQRANWRWLLDLPPESRVLDVGAGMGANSHALADHYAEVVALEPVQERICFMQERFKQERLANVKIIRSSVWTLPFPAQSFDLVAMNGVLEWVAEGCVGDPADLQEQALRKMFALLRPGGYLYIGIENRYTPGAFLGYPDPHCRLPFVTVLPRPLAQLYARRRGRNGYRNYLYSSRGYRRLLQKVGFTDVDIYVAVPSYNHPRFFFTLRNNIFAYYLHTFNFGTRSRSRDFVRCVLLRLGVLKYLEYSFAIVARK